LKDADFYKELEEELQDEIIRREEEDLEPMTFEDEKRIEERLLERKEKLKDKFRLLQIS